MTRPGFIQTPEEAWAGIEALVKISAKRKNLETMVAEKQSDLKTDSQKHNNCENSSCDPLPDLPAFISLSCNQPHRARDCWLASVVG
jgi:hypothetical protein